VVESVMGFWGILVHYYVINDDMGNVGGGLCGECNVGVIFGRGEERV